MAQVTRHRHEQPVQYTWDLDSIFATVADWEAALGHLDTQLADLAGYHGRLHENSGILADFLEKMEAMQQNVGKLFVYAGLHYSVDTEDQVWAARSDRARGRLSQAAAATAFAEPEMLAIGFEKLHQWLLQDKRLADYAHYFNQLEKRQAHVRSAEVEQILGMVQEPLNTANSTHSVLANADLKFTPATSSSGETYEITQGSIGGLLGHDDRELRRTAWQNYADAHLTLKNTMANALAGGVKRDIFFARARQYKNSLEAALHGTHIPPEVFDNLLKTYKANLPTWHRYWAIRRQALGYDTLHPYDITAPLSKNSPVVPYETAVDWIAAGMKPLGDEYAAVLRRGCLDERWVDVYPNKGKRMGAFSSGVRGTRPFIMMSYTDTLFGLSTLAHELGHSLHSYYAWQNQKIMAYTRYGLFVAEVASNFNQAMVRAHLLATHDDPEFLIAVIEEAMANFHRYFFIMPTLARFELEIHQRVEQGRALTADDLINLMADLFAEGYGDKMAMDKERVGITWAAFHTHLYSNFYVYQYATGISAAHALANGVLAGHPGAAEKYLAFLKAGGSMYPLDALNLAGVDMATPEPIETTFGVLASYVDQLEKLMAQRTDGNQ